MSSPTDRTDFAAESFSGEASTAALIEHLNVMAADDIGIGVINAQAAGAAYELLRSMSLLQGVTADDGTPVIFPDTVDVS